MQQRQSTNMTAQVGPPVRQSQPSISRRASRRDRSRADAPLRSAQLRHRTHRRNRRQLRREEQSSASSRRSPTRRCGPVQLRSAPAALTAADSLYLNGGHCARECQELTRVERSQQEEEEGSAKLRIVRVGRVGARRNRKLVGKLNSSSWIKVCPRGTARHQRGCHTLVQAAVQRWRKVRPGLPGGMPGHSSARVGTGVSAARVSEGSAVLGQVVHRERRPSKRCTCIVSCCAGHAPRSRSPVQSGAPQRHDRTTHDCVFAAETRSNNDASARNPVRPVFRERAAWY